MRSTWQWRRVAHIIAPPPRSASASASTAARASSRSGGGKWSREPTRRSSRAQPRQRAPPLDTPPPTARLRSGGDGAVLLGDTPCHLARRARAPAAAVAGWDTRWWPRRRPRPPRRPATRVARGFGCRSGSATTPSTPGRRRAGAACATGDARRRGRAWQAIDEHDPVGTRHATTVLQPWLHIKVFGGSVASTMIVCLRTVDVPDQRAARVSWRGSTRTASSARQHGILAELVLEPSDGDGRDGGRSPPGRRTRCSTPGSPRLTVTGLPPPTRTESVDYHPITRYEVAGGYLNLTALTKEQP